MCISNQIPKISVLIPTFNRADFLAETINSVLAQNYPNVEIVVVDDGSTDNTPEVIKNFPPNIKYIYQSNQGVSAARNLAFRISEGEYTLFLDSDDLLVPHSLDILVNVLKNMDIDFVYGDGWTCDQEGNITGQWSDYWTSPFASDLENAVVNNSIPIIRSALFRRTILEKIPGPFDETLIGYEDWDLAISLIALGSRIARVYENICFYRLHPGSKSLPGSKWASKRKKSFINNRLKVMNAGWFEKMSLPARYKFFSDLLLNPQLEDHELQETILSHPNFNSLPANQKCLLLSRLATENILTGANYKNELLKIINAIRINPLYPRLYVLFFLALFGPGFFKLAIKTKRHIAA